MFLVLCDAGILLLSDCSADQLLAFAVSGSLLGVAGTSSRHEGLTKPLQVRQSLDEPAQRPIDLSR